MSHASATNHDCPTWGEKIDRVLDGDLAPEEEALFRGHLAGCAVCRAALEQEEQLGALLGALPELPCPPRVVDRIAAATGVDAPSAYRPAPKPAPVHRLSHRGTLTAAVVAVAAVVLAVVLYVPTSPREDSAVAVSPEAPTYTPEEILAVREQAAYSLRLTARIINHSERKVVGGILEERIPAVIRESLKNAAQLSQGGQG